MMEMSVISPRSDVIVQWVNDSHVIDKVVSIEWMDREESQSTRGLTHLVVYVVYLDPGD
jgi:hypothetical protein